MVRVLFTLILIVTFTGCDFLSSSSETTDPCPPDPPPGFASFLPVDEGDSWTYDYRYVYVFSGDHRYREADSGTVRLTALSASCQDGQRTVVFRQEVEIVKTVTMDGVSGDSTIISRHELDTQPEMTEDSDGVTRFPFVVDPFPYHHPAELDTVVLEVAKNRILPLFRKAGGSSGMESTTKSLTQEKGLVSLGYTGCLGSVATGCYGHLTLIDFQKAASTGE